MSSHADHHSSPEPHDRDDHDLGLSHDLPRLLGRRRLFGILGGGAAVATLAACGAEESGSSSSGSSSGTTSTNATDTAETTSTGEIPEETAGPYPGDGSNGPDVLAESGVVRSDIRSSFGDANGTAEGVETTVRLTVYDASGDSMTPYSGAAVYLWHCDREGRYSMYDSDIADENYLRGVQEADDDGRIEFTTVYPAAYSGRWPHMHFEVYPSTADAQAASNRLRTSQLALPEDVSTTVYETADGYDGSLDNLESTSLDSDMVFGDGYSLQMAKVTGSVSAGYVVSLNVPV